ncbi:MAG TPA: hypothetical protein VGJ62_01940 [Gemmatimonadaceae bacterium]|jgi:hypothetical protein
MVIRRMRGSLGVSRVCAILALVLLSGTSLALPINRSPLPKWNSRAIRADAILGIPANHTVAPASLYAALATFYVPSFSRQTGLACSACHYQFPQLTPFGRLFKLNGYTLTALSTIGQPTDTAGRESLKLASIPPVAAMLVTGLTQTARAQPSTQNGTVSFPQELSVFLAGQITSHVGIFTQFTYAAADATIGIDNVDLRWARHASLANRDVLFGLTLHNNPTVQDVWNTAPAWGFPFMGSEAAPTPAASTLIDGALGQQVAGVGAYSLYDNTLYTELTAYRSAPQGTTEPLDATATNVTKGVIPYWRVALQHAGSSTYGMIGTYGFAARLFPEGVSGPTNDYTDAAADAQIEHRSRIGVWIGRAAFIHERETLSAFAAAVPPEAATLHATLSTLRTNLTFEPSLRYALTAGYFQTTGTSDPILFAPASVAGSRTGSPNSRGGIGELAVNPWQNTRFALQYLFYTLFNGSSNDYDAAGRKAADNNTLFLYLWLAF